MKQTIQIPVSELKTALTGLGKIINPRCPLPEIGCVRLSHYSGGVDIQATDLDGFATCRITGATADPFEPVLIPFESLARQVKGMVTKDSLGITFAGNKTGFAFELGGTRVERPVEAIPIEKWPTAPVIESVEQVLDETFKTALREAYDCASEDSSRYILSGAFMDVHRPGSHYVAATDGRALYSANSFNFDLPHSIILPRRKFIQWPGFMDDGFWRLAVYLAPNEQEQTGTTGAKAVTKPGEPKCSWARITSGRWTLTTKLIEGEVPNWTQVVPNEDNARTRVRFSPAAADVLQTVLPRLPGLNEPNQPVRFVVRPGSFMVAGSDRASKEATVVPILGVEASGDPIEITVNRNYVLKAFRFGLTELLLEDSLTALVFRHEGKRLVVMPMRTDAPAPTTTLPQNNPPPPPQEAATPATPPAAEAEHSTTELETKETMPANTRSTSTPTPTPAPTTVATAAPETTTAAKAPTNKPEPEDASPFKAAMAELDKLKETLRGMIVTLNATSGLLRSAEREQKAAGREVEAVRAKLRELQSVKI